MTIRDATLLDLPAVMRVAQMLIDDHVAWDPQRFQTAAEPRQAYIDWMTDLIEGTRAGCVLVACEADTVVGYLIAEHEAECTHLLSTEAIWIHDIYVDPAHRRNGAATALMNELVARYSPAHDIRLITAAPNERARAFFSRWGFRTSAIEMSLPRDRSV
jgi:ribosomal protein S18 acetylase RimI-like enzyme